MIVFALLITAALSLMLSGPQSRPIIPMRVPHALKKPHVRMSFVVTYGTPPSAAPAAFAAASRSASKSNATHLALLLKAIASVNMMPVAGLSTHAISLRPHASRIVSENDMTRVVDSSLTAAPGCSILKTS